MIGIRALASGTLSAALCVAVMPGGPDPASRLAADRLVVDRALEANDRLAELEAALAPALDGARRGAARVVAGDASPGQALSRAADVTRGAEPAALDAASAMERLAGVRRARDPMSSSPAPPLAPGQLASIADQLHATAEAGDEFAAMRRRADEVTRSMEAALVALEAADLDVAEAAVREARSHHDAVRDWDVVLVTLPVWLETTDAMIGAMETIVSATQSGDAAAAREAAAEFAALQADAGVADRALRIALSEGGSAVSAAALGRLADAVASVREARAQVAALLQAERR